MVPVAFDELAHLVLEVRPHRRIVHCVGCRFQLPGSRNDQQPEAVGQIEQRGRRGMMIDALQLHAGGFHQLDVTLHHLDWLEQTELRIVAWTVRAPEPHGPAVQLQFFAARLEPANAEGRRVQVNTATRSSARSRTR